MKREEGRWKMEMEERRRKMDEGRWKVFKAA